MIYYCDYDDDDNDIIIVFFFYSYYISNFVFRKNSSTVAQCQSDPLKKNFLNPLKENGKI